MPLTITSFYNFFRIDPNLLPGLASRLEEDGAGLALNGLIIMAPEGINGTIAGPPGAVERYCSILKSSTPLREADFKWSRAEQKPFRRFRVRVREEIVTTGSDPAPAAQSAYLSPAEWHRMLQQNDAPYALIDVRNSYETSLGSFPRAIDPATASFSEFPEFIRRAQIPTEQTVLMYCTGGIRCEKAAAEMRRRGYSRVFQLAGGILRYLEEFPNQLFHGECFVFDRRVAVTQELSPSSTYKLCPHCGDPGKERVSCANCGRGAVVCGRCLESDVSETCSKDCSYQLARRMERAQRA